MKVGLECFRPQKLSLDEEVNVLRKEVNTLRAQLQRKEAEIGALLEEKQMWGQTRATGEEHTLEVGMHAVPSFFPASLTPQLKRLIVNFVKGALSATDLKKVLEQKSLPDSILADITSLVCLHLQFDVGSVSGESKSMCTFGLLSCRTHSTLSASSRDSVSILLLSARMQSRYLSVLCQTWCWCRQLLFARAVRH